MPPAPTFVFQEGDNVRFTRGKDEREVNAVCLTWPGNVSHELIKVKRGATIEMLGVHEKLSWHREGDFVAVEIPEALRQLIPARGTPVGSGLATPAEPH